MSFLKPKVMLSAWRLLCCLFYICITHASTTYASELPPKLGERAIELAKKIDSEELYVQDDWTQNILKSDTLPAEKRFQYMRNDFNGNFWTDDKEQIQRRAAEYMNLASSVGTQRDRAIGELFTSFANNFSQPDSTEAIDKVSNAITPYLSSEDWFVRHRAYILLVEILSGYENANITLQAAQDALALIPDEDSTYAQEAKVESLEDLAYLHNLLRNPETGLQRSIELIELSKLAELPVDGAGIINNLIYSFGVWRQTETTKELVEVLIRLEENSASNDPGLTYMRAAQINNLTGNFSDALEYANASLKNSKKTSITRAAQRVRIVALAGLGRTKEARTSLAQYSGNLSEAESKSSSSLRQTLYARALIALNEGDTETALKLFNQRNDKSIQFILSTNSSETAGMLASLQNSKERQDERENALQRESELKQIALDRQKRANSLLVIIAIIFAIAAVIAIAFARYRSRTAAQMSDAADKARAGEKAKSEFLAVMSHELRTPLNGILGLADFLSRTAPSEDLREKNKIIYNSGQDLLGLVENILDMTLIEGDGIHPLAEEVNIRALLHKLEDKWRETITEKDIIFTSFIDPYVPAKMKLDPRRATQCIDNLLSNAAKFTMAGRIHMHITAKDILASNETELSVIIADTGTGISEDAQTRLFKPFVQADSSMTRHFGGAGLGLAIARSLARLMGGDITVISRENRGSEFTLTLRSEACVQEDVQDPEIRPRVKVHKEVIPTAPTPVIETPPATITQPRASKYEIIPLDHLKVLIVDDDLPCQDVLKTILAPTNCRMDCANDGNMALAKLSENTYDIILMDIRMPGMDGVTAVRHIRQSREAHNHVPIIAVTADVSAETNIKCMAAGVDIFLTKPVRAQELIDAISYVTQADRTIQSA